MKRHLLSLSDLGADVLMRLVDRSIEYATGKVEGESPLLGRTVGIYFRRSSTRTRTSFTVGAMKLGAHTVSYGPEDLQIATGETLEDTGRVLSAYLDGLVVRTNDPVAEMKALALQTDMAVINAMSAEEHPSQAIADLSTIKERFGCLEGIHLLYLGEGNNTVSALAHAFARIRDARLTIMTPEGYGLCGEVLNAARALARNQGSGIEQAHDLGQLPRKVDVVYTTRWHTLGVPKADADWRSKFEPYGVTAEVMARVSKPTGTVFMHDLPAVRGDEVTDEVLDGPDSLAWRQACYKLWSAMAVLEWALDDEGGDE